MEVLFLDDSKLRHAAFVRDLPEHCIATLVETFYQAVQALQQRGRPFDIVYLDRDLNDFQVRSVFGEPGHQVELTGEDVARFIAEMPQEQRPHQVIVHSWNPDGARRMVATCREAGIETLYRPFASPTCHACGKPISVHTGDGRVDGTGYVCPGGKKK